MDKKIAAVSTDSKAKKQDKKVKKITKDDLKNIKGGFCMNAGSGRCCGARMQ